MVKHKRGWLHELGQETARASTLGWELALPIFIGVSLGYYLDRQLGTKYTFTLGLLVAGIGAGFYNIWSFTSRIDARQKRLREKRRAEESAASSAEDDSARQELR